LGWLFISYLRPQTDTNWTVQAKTASALERKEKEPVSGLDSSDTPVEYQRNPDIIMYYNL